MSNITEQDIFKKYPKIFRDKDLPMQCMCWGLEVPDDWLPAIDMLCHAMQNYTYTGTGLPKAPQVVAEQVKSKFNQLRFYYRLDCDETNGEYTKEAIRRYHSYIDGMISLTECYIDTIEKIRRENSK